VAPRAVNVGAQRVFACVSWCVLSALLSRKFRGGGASKSQPLPLAGQAIYLGERELALPTCRDEVVEAVEALVVDGESGSLPWGRSTQRWSPAGAPVPRDGRQDHGCG
jgi:hypothetical protein